MSPRSEPTLLHVDLDAFYASVEQLDDPTLRGRPVIVGGLGRRGVVAAASYEARPHGIHSALPMGRARRLAPPDAVFLAPRFARYQELSEEVMAILADVTPLVEPIASDEAFLDVAGAVRTQGPSREIIVALRARISEVTGLTVSVGAATTKFLAKLASDLAKPDGVLIIEPGRELDLLHPLEVRRLWGVGPATGTALARLGIRTIGDLAVTAPDVLVAACGRHRADHLLALARNDDPRPVVPEREARSIGHEETYAVDLRTRAELDREITRLSERVATRLRRAARAGRTVQLKLRSPDFTTITRSRTRTEPTDVGAVIASEARSLAAGVAIGDGFRLVGVSVSHLGPAEVQGELAFGDRRGVEALERTVDAVRERFGSDALRRA